MQGNSVLAPLTQGAMCGPCPQPAPQNPIYLVECNSAEAPPPQAQRLRTPLWPSAVLYLQNRLHIGADEPGGVGDQVPQHAGALLLDSPNAAVLQLCQYL